MKFAKLFTMVVMIAGLAVLGCGGGTPDDTTTDGGGGGGSDGGNGGSDGSSSGDCTGKSCGDDDGNGGKCTACPTAGDTCDTTDWTCHGSCFLADADCEVDEDCCQGTDSAAGAWCNEEGKCAVCAKAAGTCATDYDCCPSTTPLMCTSQGACAAICEKDSDCDTTKKEVCMPNGECMPPSCSSDADCNGTLCCSGECKADCGYGDPTACAITTIGGIIHKNQTAQLYAVAYNGNPAAGGQVVPGVTFAWATTDATKVAVDAATGTITGKDAYGTATISAKAGAIDCTPTVKFTNYLPEDQGKVRVLVLDEKTGKPVEDATVLVGSDNLGATDAMGMVEKTTAAGDVHVFHAGYTYVSVVGTTKNDLVIHLTPKVDDTKAGGFKGAFDFSQVKDKAIQLGLAGNSIAGNLLDLNFNTLIGEMIVSNIKLETAKGAPTDFDDWIGLPGALVLKAEQFGAPDLLPNYRVLGEAGKRTAWGIGGGLPSKDITKLIQILSPIIGGGGDIPIGQIVAAVLPLFNKFSHAVTSIFDVVPIARITTPLAGNGEPMVDTPTMADYGNFPELVLKLTTKMALKTTFDVANLPKAQGKYMGGMAMLGGVYLPDMGMVPLGITAGLDNPDDPKVEGDGKVNAPAPADNPDGISDGQVQLRMSPNHAGTEGNQYMFVMLVLDFNSLGGGSSNAISGRVKMVDSLEPSYDLTSDKFMEFAEGTVYDRTARKITGPAAAVSGAAFYRYKVSNDKGDWFVYSANHQTAVTLPNVPQGNEDRAVGGDLATHAISLKGTTLDKLISAESGQHLNNLFDVVDAFSQISCAVKILPADADYAAKCQPTDPTTIDPACNPACEMK